MATGYFKPIPILSPADVRNFWSRVKVGVPSECWPWLGEIKDGGYGRFYIKSEAFAAHRVSYFIETGKDPGSLDVLHSCDNPPCVNSAHFFTGGNAENNRDRDLKGRMFRRLDAGAVREIRRLLDCEEISQAEIAERFAIDPVTIHDIKVNKCWQTLGATANPGRDFRKGNHQNQGAANGQAKLTADIVREIRLSLSTQGTCTVARRFGVSPNTISHIKTGRTWSHVSL